MFPTGKRGTMRGREASPSHHSSAERVILHVDMDAFYAQVEQLLQPELRGKPVIVGIGSSRRGVVTACSYEAKAFGVKAGMPGYQALELCPDAITVRGSMDRYVDFSKRTREVFAHFTPIVEPASIDEAFLEVTACMKLFGDPVSLAAALKDEMKDRVGLTCSVGVSYNKHFAKVASALEKPDGLTTIWRHEIRDKMFPLKVSKLYGVGPVTTKTLNEIGIHTVGQLAEAPLALLKKHIGSAGEHFKRVANGEDVSTVHDHDDLSDEKSISHSRTFDYDSGDIEYLHSVLLHLTDKVVSRMKAGHFFAKTITLKVRFADFTTITRDRSINCCTDDVQRIYRTARSLLPTTRVKKEKVRLLGVRVSNLTKLGSEQQFALFDDSRSEKRGRAADVVEDIRKKFGKESVVRGGSLRYLDKKKS